jgi:hypothetical protein
VRLIEIEGQDVAACALEHASSLRECEFFLVTRIARAGGDLGYEIDFVVQTQTKEASLSFSWNTIENIVKKADRHFPDLRIACKRNFS